MEIQSQAHLNGQKMMLPPPPGTFNDREDLIKHVREFAAKQGYVVTIKKSRKDRRVILGCDRGGVYRNRRKIEECKRKRKASSRLINCPFEAIGKKEADKWELTIKNGEHNHEPLSDISEHPYSRRFSEEEVRQIKVMTEAGVKPRQVLKALKESNPELQSTPRHLYNLKAKIRQGNLSEQSFQSWRHNRVIPVDTSLRNPSEASSVHSNYPVPNFIGGKFVESQGCVILDVVNPATQEIVSQIPLTTYEEFKDAVAAAKQAFLAWRSTSISTRQRIMFKLQELIRRDIDKLAMNIAIEQGKTLKCAQADVLRGLEMVEHACGMANLQMGDFVPNSCIGIDTFCIREPLGVCAGICPLNFPAMIPLWMFPIAVICGNTYVLKPSEKNPGSSMILAAIAKEAGLPDGVLNIVHGTHDTINHICDDDDIKAISFVGSSVAGMHIYARAASRGKRVQSNMGAKNHAIIMPDASMDPTMDAVVAAGFGAAGQRGLTLSTIIFVGSARPWEEELMERTKALEVNAGTEPSADLGPVISKEAKDHICRLVHSAVESGARLLLDGRNIVVPGYENGNFVGPTILCDVTTAMECYKEEFFGPVLLCMQANNLEEAVAIVNRNKHRNGASIFTNSGVTARKFQTEVETRLVGINVPVPVPYSNFNGLQSSFAGDTNFCGKAGVEFYTQIKTVCQQWKDLPTGDILQAQPPQSERDSTSGDLSLSLPPPSDNDVITQGPTSMHATTGSTSSDCEPLLPMPLIYERDLQDPGILVSMSTAETELSSLGGSLSVPSTSDRELANQGISGAMVPDVTRDSTGQARSLSMPETSKRIYVSQTAEGSESSPSGSQIHNCDTFPSIPERIYASKSQSKDNMAHALQRTDGPKPPVTERLYMSTTSHRNDTVTTISQRADSALPPTSEGVYIPLSHGNDTIGIKPQRLQCNMHPASDRLFMPASQRTKDIGPASQRSKTAMRSSSQRLYVPPLPQRIDGMGSLSQRANNSMLPSSERMYLHTSHRNEKVAPGPQSSDTLSLPSERICIPSEIQMSNGMAAASERLYMPTSERMYSENPIISMDDFSGEEMSLTLPTSERI
ncbi:Aldehyde dehydrogenase domain [Dillenia turbinata]|uniref:methylmalonate-semialdehyde dehydrogenase (CoA acylating) n=1 Tax=Dillenia turbinata TaxID=194707 RepID=A0AAN8UVK4_9MAGN